MKDFIQKFKDFYGKIKTKQTSYERPSIRPAHDWHILLTSTVILLLASAGISFYFYTQINNGTFFVIEDDSIEKEVKIDNVLLKKTIDDINVRKSNRLDIQQGRNIPADPSL